MQHCKNLESLRIGKFVAEDKLQLTLSTLRQKRVRKEWPQTGCKEWPPTKPQTGAVQLCCERLQTPRWSSK